MRNKDKLHFLTPLILLSIATVFAYVASIVMQVSETLYPTLALVLAFILGGLTVFFFAGLAVASFVIAYLMILDSFHRHTIARQRRELELEDYKRQRQSQSQQPARHPTRISQNQPRRRY
jgi:hypothetical protein